MAGRVHPTGMNGLRIRPDGNILGDDAEPRASLGEARFQIRLVGKLVLDQIQIHHTQRVLPRGFEKSAIPLQR